MKQTHRWLAIAALLPALTLSQAFAAEEAAKPEAKPAAAEKVEYSKKGADTCLTCHDDEHVMAVFKTPHGQPNDARSPFGKGQLQCEACHGPGGNHTKKVKKGETRPPMIRFGRDSATPVSVQNGGCLACHEKSMTAEWHAGPHAANDVSCAACHDTHVAKDPVLDTHAGRRVPHLPRRRARPVQAVPAPGQGGQGRLHRLPQPHGSTAPRAAGEDHTNETCYQCHADKRGPFLWEHPPVDEDCGHCHKPHGSVQSRMLNTRGPCCASRATRSKATRAAYGGPACRAPRARGCALMLGNCMNCHTEVHGSNHPSGSSLTR